MIRSFRLRLALHSALLSGFALTAFGFSAWWQIHNMRIARLASDVRAHAERESNRRRDIADWQRTEATIASQIDVRNSDDLLLLVEDGDGRTLYRSPRWPPNFDITRLQWPKREGGPESPEPGPEVIPEPAAADSAPPSSPPPPQDATGPRPATAGSDFSPGGPPPPAPQPPIAQRAEGENPPPPNTPGPETMPPGPPPASVAISQTVDGHVWHLGLATTNSSRIAVAVDVGSIDADMRGIRNAFLVALPLALILIGIGGWAFSTRALRPVQKLTAATRRVTAEGLDQRISVQGEDREFVELIGVFNPMLERLERSFQQAYRFSADAAHELKTPLAILQGQLEHAIHHSAEEGSSMQAELTSILDEVRRLSTISRKLLLLSQADAGRLNLHREPFDLSQALADLVEDTRMLAPHLQVTGEIHPGLIIPADGALVRQVLHNLISNAIKYNVEQGWIRISMSEGPKQVEVLVVNSSSGIPSAEREKVFDRFYRADSAHSRGVEGVGLGLSVSREIARAHGGDITLRTERDGTVQFSLLLPSIAPPDGA